MELSRDLYKMQWATDISSLANQARFGLRYFEKGNEPDETVKLIKDGVRLCEILSKGFEAGQGQYVLPKQIGYLKAIRPLKEASVDFGEMTTDVNHVSDVLNSIINDENPSEEEIRKTDSFFIKISKIYQQFAFCTLNSLVEEKVFC